MYIKYWNIVGNELDNLPLKMASIHNIYSKSIQYQC